MCFMERSLYLPIFFLHLSTCAVVYDARDSFASVTGPNELFGGENLLKKHPKLLLALIPERPPPTACVYTAVSSLFVYVRIHLEPLAPRATFKKAHLKTHSTPSRASSRPLITEREIRSERRLNRWKSRRTCKFYSHRRLRFHVGEIFQPVEKHLRALRQGRASLL